MDFFSLHREVAYQMMKVLANETLYSPRGLNFHRGFDVSWNRQMIAVLSHVGMLTTKSVLLPDVGNLRKSCLANTDFPGTTVGRERRVQQLTDHVNRLIGGSYRKNMKPRYHADQMHLLHLPCS